MKKVILSAIAVLAFGFANAQDVKFGVKGGLNIASISPNEGGSSKIGFNLGGFADIKISDKFHVQPELLYSGQGEKNEFSGVTVNSNLNYINIPVMAKFFVAEGFNIQAGPQLGFLLSADVSGNGQSVSIKDQFKTVDFGVNFGLGYDIGENMMVDLRYNLGLGGLAKDLPSGAKDSNNRVIALSFGYKF